MGHDKALAARPKIKGQVLMIPALVHYDCYALQIAQLRDPSVSSWVENREAPVLPFARVKLFLELLGLQGGSKDLEKDLRLNPGNASAQQVKGLPPATFGVAGRDPLRDEGLLFAKLLSENGYVCQVFVFPTLAYGSGFVALVVHSANRAFRVPTKTNVFRGVPHGFRRYGDALSVSKKWDETVVEGIQFALGNPQPGPFEIHAF
jgi:acetyl esterase/lipase